MLGNEGNQAPSKGVHFAFRLRLQNVGKNQSFSYGVSDPFLSALIRARLGSCDRFNETGEILVGKLLDGKWVVSNEVDIFIGGEFVEQEQPA